MRLLLFCSERFFSLPPRGRTEGACVQKQIRCLFGWCNTIVAQAPPCIALRCFPSSRRRAAMLLAFAGTLGGCAAVTVCSRDVEGCRPLQVCTLFFVCAFADCMAVSVCLRTTDGRPYGSNVVCQSVANLTLVRIQGVDAFGVGEIDLKHVPNR